MLAIGVRTPLAEITALLVNAPAAGIDDTKLPNMLHKPSVNISCVAFTLLPLAKNTIYISWITLCIASMRNNYEICGNLYSTTRVWTFRNLEFARRFFTSISSWIALFLNIISKHFDRDARFPNCKLSCGIRGRERRVQKFNANLEELQ